MLEMIYKSKITQNILAKRRRKRVDFILSKVDVFQGMSILDVGCGPDGRSFEDLVDKDYIITGIDIIDDKNVATNHPNFKYYKQNAQDISMFVDNEFDLAVSIGMMEHICDKEVLKNMYYEINRVARQWAIVVPWKYSFIEPHFKLPFFQLLPYKVKVILTICFNLHGLSKSVQQNENYINNNYQWLDSRQWTDIFEGARCYVTPHMDTIAIVKSNN